MNFEKRQNNYIHRQGFSLAEVLAALVIGSLILVAVIGVFSRAQRAAIATEEKLESGRLPNEILQRIAEDIDRIIIAEQDTRITIENKLTNGFPAARMEIVKSFYGEGNKAQVFEKIIWQASYDYESLFPGLILYRSYSGMVSEDKLFDEERKDWEEKYSFIPICRGITFFKIQAINRTQLADEWSVSSMPGGIVTSISFAEPFKMPDGSWEVPEDEKFVRTVAIDRTRKIKFKFRKIESKKSSFGKKTDTEQEDEKKIEDTNEPNEPADSNEAK